MMLEDEPGVRRYIFEYTTVILKRMTQYTNWKWSVINQLWYPRWYSDGPWAGQLRKWSDPSRDKRFFLCITHKSGLGPLGTMGYCLVRNKSTGVWNGEIHRAETNETMSPLLHIYIYIYIYIYFIARVLITLFMIWALCPRLFVHQEIIKKILMNKIG
jgi:hypothetical protein